MLSLALSVCLAAEPVSSTAQIERKLPVEDGSGWVRGGAEFGFLSLPTGAADFGQESFLTVTPILGWGSERQFSIELGAPIRWGLNEQTGNTTLRELGQLVRLQDWDERSDFGQILRRVQWGEEGQEFHLTGGAFTRYTLGHGHLVNRYSNQENPNYHPAGLHAEGVLGPMRAQAFASDVLGARLFAADLSMDLGRTFGSKAEHFDVTHFSVSAAQDFGEAGQWTPRMSAVHVDVDVMVYREKMVQLTLLSGAGARLYAPPTDFGFLVGALLDARLSRSILGLKVEVRRQAGLVRQGLFGPNYEMSRFAGMGFSGVPLSEERLPAGVSGYTELRWSSAPVNSNSSDSRFWMTAAFEVFSSQRIDADVQAALQLSRTVTGTLRASVVGLGVAPRYSMQAEARYRFIPSVYAMSYLGNVFFPQPDNWLVRGVFAGVGMGLDFES